MKEPGSQAQNCCGCLDKACSRLSWSTFQHGWGESHRVPVLAEKYWQLTAIEGRDVSYFQGSNDNLVSCLCSSGRPAMFIAIQEALTELSGSQREKRSLMLGGIWRVWKNLEKEKEG